MIHEVINSFFGMRVNGIMIFNHTRFTPETSQQNVIIHNYCFKKKGSVRVCVCGVTSLYAPYCN